MTDHHDRHIAIIFYKFAVEPGTIAQAAGYKDVETVRVGDLVGRSPSKDNRITWRFPFFNDDTWPDAIAGLVAALGGEQRLRELRE